MRKVTISLMAVLVGAALTVIASAQDQSASQASAAKSSSNMSRSYKGEIMDAPCAKMGSHGAMMKQEGATSAKECSDKCVQSGSKYVLYDKTHKRTYSLDDQDKAKQFSGQQVTVKGTLDRATRTIKVESMDAAS